MESFPSRLFFFLFLSFSLRDNKTNRAVIR